MVKIKTIDGYRHVKELGGAIQHKSPSPVAQFLIEQNKIKGRVLDYGCGHGFDVQHYGWEGYDPYYFQDKPVGQFNTIVCNHVANILTRHSRLELYRDIDRLLAAGGRAYIAVSRRIPIKGKDGLRKRIQNYVILTLPSVHFVKDEFEIYEMAKGVDFEDNTQEFLGEK